jgi:predicted transcriptional regulator of viral defense system
LKKNTIFVSVNPNLFRLPGMKILYFLQTFQRYPVFSTLDIEKHFPHFDRENLLHWQEKGYIQRLRNGWYRVKQDLKSPLDLYFIANKIYSPSYVSLESAFAHYGWIPEGVFSTISLSTKKTTAFQTPVGQFQYQKIKTSLFFGYRLLKTPGGFGVKLAEPEKALLDYLYFHPNLQAMEDFEALRLNTWRMKEDLDAETLHAYAALFDSTVMNKRLKVFQEMLSYAETS